MVDCGSAQCAQERRTFRNELLSWSKKIPMTVALETIAEELGAKDVMKDVFEPLNCLEPEELTDWEPQKECFYCSARLTLLFDIVDQMTEDVKNGKSDVDYPGLRNLHELLPYCPQFYTHGFGRECLESNNVAKSAQTTTTPSSTEDGGMSVPSTSKGHIELKIPRILMLAGRKKESMNGKKAYTNDDLSQAVTEIRDGKLGTRRAAMLYGIPRSTLRNKIFKMVSEENLQMDLDDSSSADEVIPDNGMKLSDLMQTSSFTYLPPLPFPLPIKKEPDTENFDGEFDRKMELLRRKHNLNGARDNLRTPAHSPELKLPLLGDLIRKMVQQRLEMECHSASVTSLSETKLVLKREIDDAMCSMNPFASFSPCYGLGMTTANLSDLRIPSYKPGNSSSKGPNAQNTVELLEGKCYENSKIGDALKDIIVRSISEKLKFHDQSNDDSSGTLTPDEYCPRGSFTMDSSQQSVSPPNSIPVSSSHLIGSSGHNPKRYRKDSVRDKHSMSGSSGIKKTRPKRGQYRKYNSQLLMEAVRAVQRGEMSVHRAGSYFGVPHSTLEYKVKERHLLRQKKVRESQMQKEAGSSVETNSNTSASSPPPSTQVTSESLQISPLGFTSPKQSTSSGLPWLQPFVNGSTAFDPTMGLFPSGFSLNTPASELLRKLQHKVQSKSSSFTQDDAFNFPRPNGVGSLQERFLLFN
ncbi:ligand-dependent nuclear receptor corepressor-like protein [Gigantopelta aegis]|uniref:ligand-dependent nuclear receptor corepressor-like protein n=1 Tax=Gigantopelta aegis TaxID=1735272 RepID=UPI001B889EB1|nr:ligand-dependent nuclear receptor corepressor-like protein [Gigantopelta aegis]